MNGQNPPESSEMLSLLGEVQDTGTNIFEILDLDTHEKRLTRFLAWLFDPTSGHDAEQAFLDAFMECFDISLEDTTDVTIRYLESFNSSEFGECEIDLVVETGAEVVGVEIKTTHSEERQKFVDEAGSLTEYAAENDGKAAMMLYLPRSKSEAENAEYADYAASWEDVIVALSKARGELQTPFQVALFDDFEGTINRHVIDRGVGFSKESELYLKYRDKLDEFDVDIGPNSYKNDRKEIYNQLWEWFESRYEPWDGQFERERGFSKRTKYVTLYKDSWHLDAARRGQPEFTLEIQGTEKRLCWYDGWEGKDSYRPPVPHFEMTVALNDDSEEQERRERYHEYLSEREQEALSEAGFKEVSSLLTKRGADATYNKYHMFSKIIEVDFDYPEEMIADMQQGLKAFVALEESIDEFTREYRQNLS